MEYMTGKFRLHGLEQCRRKDTEGFCETDV